MNKIFSRYMKEFGVTEDFLIGFIRNFSGIDQRLIKNNFLSMVDDISWLDIIRFAHKLAPSVYTWLERNGLSLNIPAERKKAILDLPGFSKKQIQESYNFFEYDVYYGTVNEG